VKRKDRDRRDKEKIFTEQNMIRLKRRL